MNVAIGLALTLALAEPSGAWRVLFAADAGPVVLVEIEGAARADGDLDRRAEVLLVTADRTRTKRAQARARGLPPSGTGVPSGVGDVTTDVGADGSVVVTISNADEMAKELASVATPGVGPTVANARAFRVVLSDAISDVDDDRVVSAVVATTRGLVPGRALVGRRVIPSRGSAPVLFVDGVLTSLPADAYVVATTEGCGGARARALVTTNGQAPMQILLGLPACATAGVIQRATRISVDKKGATRAPAVFVTPAS